MRPATLQDKELIVGILSAAFDANKSVNYVVKQDSRRKERIRMLMTYTFNMCYTFGEVFLSDNCRACALILFTEKKRTTLSTIIWDIKLALSVIGVNRVNYVLKREETIKSHQPKVPFAYLWLIGVDPAFQKMQAGTKLLKEVMDRYHAANRQVYLETSMESNVNWYTKNGFDFFHTIELSYPLYLLRSRTKS